MHIVVTYYGDRLLLVPLIEIANWISNLQHGYELNIGQKLEEEMSVEILFWDLISIGLAGVCLIVVGDLWKRQAKYQQQRQ